MNTPISEIKLSYTRKVKSHDRPKIRNAEDAYRLFRENWEDQSICLCEEFKILLLDRSHHCMGIVSISKGGFSGTMVDAKVIFAAALKARACAIILGHNHPSGNLHPSQQDQEITSRLVKGGQLLSLPILDHIIVTNEGYYSMSNQGLIPTPA